MHLRKQIAALPLVLLLAGCAAGDNPDTEDGAATSELAASEADAAARAGIDRLFEEMKAPMMSGDAAAFVNYWTEDVHLLEPDVDVRGRAALQTFVGDFFAAGNRVVSIEFQRGELFVHGDAAYETGSYVQTIRGADGQEASVNNNYFARFEKQADGSWKFDRVVEGPIRSPAS